MAYILTYDQLVEDIKDYSNRYDEKFIAKIPGFVFFAIDKITKDLNNSYNGNLGAEKFITTNLIPNSNVLKKPALWAITASINIGVNPDTGAISNKRKFLKSESYQNLRELYPDDTTLNIPQVYSDYDFEHWLIAPTPAEAYPVEIAYLSQFTPLDEQNQINWLSQYAPNVLFQACLISAANYTQNAQVLALREDQYSKAISALISQNEAHKTDAYSNRNKV